jgi:creatinine amidohydrolase
MIWDELTSANLGKVARKTPILLPVAATEQHGPHLPLATDRMIGEHLARRLHETIPDEVLILPIVSVGCSEHHMSFPGSLTVSHETFLKLVVEILDSVAAHGFTNLIIFNAHGGNIGIGNVAMEIFGKRHPDVNVVMMTWWTIAAEALLELTETAEGGIGHACEFETSLIMHIRPDLVQMDEIRPGYPRPTFDWTQADMLRSGKARLYRAADTSTFEGVHGDPTAASPEKGRAVEKAVLESLLTIARSLAAD